MQIVDVGLYKKVIVDQETINNLRKVFKPDVEKLSQIIEQDITHWLEKY
jgi:hypothetical protein